MFLKPFPEKAYASQSCTLFPQFCCSLFWGPGHCHTLLAARRTKTNVGHFDSVSLSHVTPWSWPFSLSRAFSGSFSKLQGRFARAHEAYFSGRLLWQSQLFFDRDSEGSDTFSVVDSSAALFRAPGLGNRMPGVSACSGLVFARRFSRCTRRRVKAAVRGTKCVVRESRKLPLVAFWYSASIRDLGSLCGSSNVLSLYS